MIRLRSPKFVCALAGSALLLSGCGTNVTPDTTLSQLLDQITVGDVITAFQQFATLIGSRHGHGLTDAQQAQVEDLQAQLDAGTITKDEFNTKVQAILGDQAPHQPFVGFGFFGGPMGGGFGFGAGGFLDLSDDQITQAKAIFDKAHTDIEALQVTARDAILAVLTDEQKAKLDQIAAGVLVGLPPGAGMNTARHHGPGFAFDRFTSLLNLTDDQKTQIDKIRTDLRTAVEARHQQARDEFMTILTDEQKATIQAWQDFFDKQDGSSN